MRGRRGRFAFPLQAASLCATLAALHTGYLAAIKLAAEVRSDHGIDLADQRVSVAAFCKLVTNDRELSRQWFGTQEKSPVRRILGHRV
jgi:hypothetical protein